MTEFAPQAAPTPFQPLLHTRKAVVIVAMGSSRTDFTTMQMMENRADLLKGAEVWGINYLGAAWYLDRLIHVDPVWAYLGNEVVRDMCERTAKNGTPVYTSWPYNPTTNQTYPNFRLYPFDEITRTLGGCYINGSVSAAIAMALYEGFNEISLFGCDFSYPDAHVSESGRACCEFWLGVATQRGVKIAVAQNSTLLDISTGQQPYGWFADPMRPPVMGGGLMNVQQIYAHCDRMRNPRVAKPNFFTFEPTRPDILQAFVPGGTPHPEYSTGEEAVGPKPNGHDVGDPTSAPGHIQLPN